MLTGGFEVRDTPTRMMSASASSPGTGLSSCRTVKASASSRSKYPSSIWCRSPAWPLGDTPRNSWSFSRSGPRTSWLGMFRSWQACSIACRSSCDANVWMTSARLRSASLTTSRSASTDRMLLWRVMAALAGRNCASAAFDIFVAVSPVPSETTKMWNSISCGCALGRGPILADRDRDCQRDHRVRLRPLGLPPDPLLDFGAYRRETALVARLEAKHEDVLGVGGPHQSPALGKNDARAVDVDHRVARLEV